MRRDRSRRDDARQVRASCSPSPHSAPDRFLPRDLAHVVPGSPRLLLPSLDAARPPARASPCSSWTPRTRTAARSARSRSPRRRWVGRPLLGESRTPGGDARRTRVRFFRRGRRRGDRHLLPRAGRPRGRARARRRDELLLPGDAERLEPPATALDRSGPRLALGADAFVDVLVRSGAHAYVEFKALDATAIFSPAPAGTPGSRAVPASRADVFRDKTLGLTEKRALMRVLKRVVRLAERGGVVVGAGDPDAADARSIGARAAGRHARRTPGHQNGGSSLPEEEDALAPLYEREDELFSVALERLGLGAPRASASLGCAVRARAERRRRRDRAARIREPHGVPRVPAPVRTGRRCRAPAYVRRRRVPAGVRQARRRARRDVRAARRGRAPRVPSSR